MFGSGMLGIYIYTEREREICSYFYKVPVSGVAAVPQARLYSQYFTTHPLHELDATVPDAAAVLDDAAVLGGAAVPGAAVLDDAAVRSSAWLCSNARCSSA